jgi:hypothetical protein
MIQKIEQNLKQFFSQNQKKTYFCRKTMTTILTTILKKIKESKN